MKLDQHKLNCMTTSLRLYGFLQGWEATEGNKFVREMMLSAAALLLVEWNQYAAEIGYPQFSADGEALTDG